MSWSTGERKKMMKAFYEVFPTLRLSGELGSLFDEVEVKRVASNGNRNFLKVYIYRSEERRVGKECRL